MMNKIEYKLNTLLNELQTFQSLLINKEQAGEANVAVSKKLLREANVYNVIIQNLSRLRKGERLISL